VVWADCGGGGETCDVDPSRIVSAQGLDGLSTNSPARCCRGVLCLQEGKVPTRSRWTRVGRPDWTGARYGPSPEGSQRSRVRDARYRPCTFTGLIEPRMGNVPVASSRRKPRDACKKRAVLAGESGAKMRGQDGFHQPLSGRVGATGDWATRPQASSCSASAVVSIPRPSQRYLVSCCSAGAAAVRLGWINGLTPPRW
jgi:hypothetical protein